MRPPRINRDAPRSHGEATKPLAGTSVPVVIPANSWVAERSEEDGSKTLLPLPAWELVDGDLLPLPHSLREGWVIRPAMEGDDRAIRNTSARMRPNNANAQPSAWQQWRTNLRP